MVTILPLISNSSSPSFNLLETVPSAPITFCFDTICSCSIIFCCYSLVWWCLRSVFPVLVSFLFSELSDFFLYFVDLFLPSIVVFSFSLLVWCIFLCQILPLYPVGIFSLAVSRLLIFFIFDKQFDAVHIN